jgi:hypothetical protein
MLHHTVRLITAQPQFEVRDEDWERRQENGPSPQARLNAIWNALARSATVDQEAYVYCTARPWEC